VKYGLAPHPPSGDLGPDISDLWFSPLNFRSVELQAAAQIDARHLAQLINAASSVSATRGAGSEQIDLRRVLRQPQPVHNDLDPPFTIQRIQLPYIHAELRQ
jgi:hypothetical protein